MDFKGLVLLQRLKNSNSGHVCRVYARDGTAVAISHLRDDACWRLPPTTSLLLPKASRITAETMGGHQIRHASWECMLHDSHGRSYETR